MTDGDQSKTQAAAAKPELPCDNCGKKLKSTTTLKNHMARFHEGVQHGVQHVANLIMSPKGPSSSPGPSNASSATFNPNNDPALTPASTSTPPPNPLQRQLFEEETETELQSDMDVLLAAAREEEELYEALEKLTEDVIAPEEEKETRENIKEKLARYKSIMNKKNNIIKAASEEIKSLKLSKEAYKHDSKMQEDILEQQKRDLDKIEKKNDKLNRDKVDVMRELEVLRESNGSLNKKNNDFSEMLKVKDGLIRALREEIGAEEDEDEVEVAETVEDVADAVEEVTEVVRMNKVSKYHNCNACNKNFKTSQDLENHVGSKHVEKDCNFCEKRFRNEHELGKHLKTCDKIGTANKVCNKCNKKFTGPGLVRHNPTCHGNDTEYECPLCGEIFNSSGALEDHQDQQHEMEQVRSREVCFHWRRGNCLKGDSCRFSHVGPQNKTGSNKTTAKVARCKNGASCEWLANNTCSFFHPRIGVQRP